MDSIRGDTTAVREILGKGLGLVALKTIKKGTRILSESPTIRVPRFGHSQSKQQLEDRISRDVAGLSDTERQAFYSLSNSFEVEAGPVLGRIRTNALPLGSDATEGAIFLRASRINHACLANAQNTWNERLKKITIHAVQDIARDEEITICYLDARSSRRQRIQELQTKFGFTCSCALCSLPARQREHSDKAWEEIGRLDESIACSALYRPLETLHDVHRLLTLLAEQGCTDAGIPRAYYDAFQIAVAQGDVARASVFAKRAASAREILEGGDSLTTQKMESLAQNPAQHQAYGISGAWKTKAATIPSDLQDQRFEEWLWRKASILPPQTSSSAGSPHPSKCAALRCPVTFPTFKQLPEENDLGFTTFDSEDDFSYRTRRHWCFLAEIVDVEWFLRLSLFVKDKNGDVIRLAFYTERRGYEEDSSLLKKGYTVAGLYAEQHGFMDMSEGIRHENPNMIKIFPWSLDKMLSLGDRVERYVTKAKGKRTCAACEQESSTLLRCARCGLFWYCNKACQKIGWDESGHKMDCKMLKNLDLKGLLLADWEKFDGRYRFPLRVPEQGDWHDA